jgi:hypothetical protein
LNSRLAHDFAFPKLDLCGTPPAQPRRPRL